MKIKLHVCSSINQYVMAGPGEGVVGVVSCVFSGVNFRSPVGDYAKHELKLGRVVHSVVEPRFMSNNH